MEIKFHINKDCRKFKEGQNYILNVPEKGILYVGGRNGCGKSTLLQIIRHQKDSLKKPNKNDFDGMSTQHVEMAAMEPITMSGMEYDEVFCLDAIVDDPTNLFNSVTAYGFVSGGGMAAQRHSKGENALVLIERFRKKINAFLTEKYESLDEWKSSNKRGLIVLDEVDEGLDANLQCKWNHILQRIMINELGCDVICVTHNPICILSPIDDMVPMVYSIDVGLSLNTEEYFLLATGCEISIKRVI